MPNTDFVGSLYAYPWDLADEGVDAAMELFATTNCEEIMLTPCYHQSTFFLPHNPKRPVYPGDDGAIYFAPELSRYDNTRMKPYVSKEVTDPSGSTASSKASIDTVCAWAPGSSTPSRPICR